MKPQRPARPTVMATPTEDRYTYTKILADLSGNPKAIVTPGYLRLEQVLGTQNRVDFPVLTNEGVAAARASERRLNPSDAFYVTRVNVNIQSETVASGAGTAEPHVWANPAVWTGADQPGLAFMMNTGRLQVEVDGVVYIQGMDLFRFRYVDEAQQALPVGAGAFGADGWDPDKVFQANTPVFRLNGGSSNQVSILLGATQAMGATIAGTANVVSVVLHGWLAQNAGQFNPNNRR